MRIFKFLLFIFFLFFINLVSAQVVTIDDAFKIEHKKSKVIDKRNNFRSPIKVKGDVKKIQTIGKVKLLNANSFDVNSISLLDTVNKIRYRFMDYMAYHGVSVIKAPKTGSKRYLKTEILNKKGKPYKDLPKYDSSVHDSFFDFDFSDYRIVECPIQFHTTYKDNIFKKTKDLISVAYYSPTTLKEFTFQMYFLIPPTEKPPSFQLYFGKQKIANISID